jgi:tape measure domain-containing protein
MATISSSVQMYDNMSPVINGITNALNICISSFESMQRASGQAVDTSSLQAARQHLSGAEASFMQVEQSMKNAGNGQQDFNNKLVQGQNNADGLASKLKNAVGVYATFKTLGEVFKSSDELVQTQARLGLINDGLRTQEELQNQIFQSAQRSRASYSDTAAVVARLGTLAKGAFSGNDEMVAFAEQMNKQFKIGGASLQEQTAGMYQLSQAMASGKLQGDEFRSIMENAPMLAQAISTYTGKTMGDLRKMSSEGEITAAIIKKSLFATAADTEARFAKMPKTIGEIWTSIKNQALMAFQPVLLKINEIANNPNVTNFITILVNGFSMISIVALNLINTISNIAAFFQSNWGIIEPLIMGIVAAFLAYNTALLINNIYTGITTAIKTAATIAAVAHGAAITAEMLATTGMTGSQLAFNAALYACPLTWIILLIIALVAIFYLAIAAMNKFAGTSYSATGIIAGIFMALGAVIYNVIAFVWNIIAAFVEFFANAFTNPAEANKRLFLNLNLAIINGFLAATKGCDTFATNFANAILTGINIAIEGWNNFVDILNSFGGIADAMGLGKGTEFEYTASISSDLSNAKSLIESELSKPVENYISVPRMESLDIGAQFNKGYAWGSSVDDWANKLLNPQQQDMGNGYDYNDLLNKAANNTGDTAKNTKDIKDKLDITDEDLKYLRDIAEQDAINRFTTAEVKVEMNNRNSINSELDLSSIVDILGQGLQESLQIVAEGATYSV